MDARERFKAKYHAYLLSDEWRNRRACRAYMDGHRCLKCGSTENLETHHVTYERLFRERMRDLITLCHKCHDKYHRGV